MRTVRTTLSLIAAGLLFAAASGPAAAAGCVSGAAVGGVAGHVAGHHGLLGAAAGCVIGRHEANKHAREQARVDEHQRAAEQARMAHDNRQDQRHPGTY